MDQPEYLNRIDSFFRQIDEMLNRARRSEIDEGFKTLVEVVKALSDELREFESRTQRALPPSRPGVQP